MVIIGITKPLLEQYSVGSQETYDQWSWKNSLFLEEHTYKPITGHKNEVDREKKGRKAES